MEQSQLIERISLLENTIDKLNVDIEKLTDFCNNIMTIIKTDQERMKLLEESICQICTGETPKSETDETDLSDINLNEDNMINSLENLAAYNATSYYNQAPISIENAVLTDNWTEATKLAKQSGVSLKADNLEGRILQGDYTTARALAQQRNQEQ